VNLKTSTIGPTIQLHKLEPSKAQEDGKEIAKTLYLGELMHEQAY